MVSCDGLIIPGTQAQNSQDHLNIDANIIHNLANLLYSNGNRSCFGHPLSNGNGIISINYQF